MTAMPSAVRRRTAAMRVARLGRGEGGGGLVEDEDARVPGDGLGDLDQLAGTDGQLFHEPVGVDVGAQPGQRRGRPAIDLAVIDEAQATTRLAGEQDVGADRHLGDEAELLEHHRDVALAGRGSPDPRAATPLTSTLPSSAT